MSWEDFKKHGTYKFLLKEPHIAFREQMTEGVPFETASGKIEIFSTYLAGIKDWKKTQFGYPIPYLPKWIEPFESLNHPKIAKKYPFHLISPHPRWRTHSIFNNIPGCAKPTQEVTINASDAAKLGVKTGDTVEVWNDRGKCVVPVYVTERLHARCGGAVRRRVDGPRQEWRGPRRQPRFPDPGRAQPCGRLRLQQRAGSDQEDRSGPSPGVGRAGRRPLVRVPPRHVNTGTLP
jgi:anaerobic selenocysteine-containing dehydrogenase